LWEKNKIRKRQEIERQLKQREVIYRGWKNTCKEEIQGNKKSLYKKKKSTNRKPKPKALLQFFHCIIGVHSTLPSFVFHSRQYHLNTAGISFLSWLHVPVRQTGNRTFPSVCEWSLHCVCLLPALTE